MNEFLTFITTGNVEHFENNPKEKYLYLLRISYYTSALLLTIAICYEMVGYMSWGSFESTILGNMYDVIEYKEHLGFLLKTIISPLIAGFALWLCTDKFNFENICLSISIIISTITYYIVDPLNIIKLHNIGFIEELDVAKYIAFCIFTGLMYLILLNSISYNFIRKFRLYWNKYLPQITYGYIALFVLYMLTFINLNVINVLACTSASLFIGFLLVYVRRLLGLKYAMILHYIILLPLISVMIYMLEHNCF